MSYTSSRLSAAAVVLLSPLAFWTVANSAEPAPDLGYARNGGLPYEQTDLGYARNGAVSYQEPDIGRARNEVTVPSTAPAPGVPVDTGIGADSWVLVGATGAAVLGLGVAGGMIVRRRQHHLPHPV